MIISFIIPVYNTEQYVEKCVLSIINQGMDKGEYEIILVDDGSTDDSPKILSNLEQKYSQIKLISQENRGLGAARNVALRLAQGDYVFFVDSDDYILPNAMLPFLEFINENKDAEIICFNTERESSGKKYRHITRDYVKQDFISGVDYLDKYRLYVSVWSSVYSRVFLINNSIFMPEGVFHEDELFTTEVFVQANNIFFFHFPVYVYVNRVGSITNPKTAKEKHKLFDDLKFVLNELLSLLNKDAFTDKQKQALRVRLDWFLVDFLRVLSRVRYDVQLHEGLLNHLSDKALFPLRKGAYSWKYSVFSFFFKNKKRAMFVFKLGLRF